MTVTVTGNLKKLDDTGDQGTVTAIPENGFTDSNNQVPVQTLQDTADAAGAWSLLLIADQFYIFEFAPTDTNTLSKKLRLRRYVTGVGSVDFDTLEDQVP
jgi:hypothetical protein